MTERYLLGELGAEETAAFEEHFFECGVCAADIRRANRMLANLKVELRGQIAEVELHPDDEFVELAFELKTANHASVECECHFEGNPRSIEVTASPKQGLIHLQLRATDVAPGRCEVIVRAPGSRSEIERHHFVIRKAPGK